MLERREGLLLLRRGAREKPTSSLPACLSTNPTAPAAQRPLLCAATHSREGTQPPGTPGTAQQLGTLMRSRKQIPGWDPAELQADEGSLSQGLRPPRAFPLLISIDLLSKSMLAVPSPAPAGRRDEAAAPNRYFSIIRLLKEMPPGCTRLVHPAALPSPA